MNLTLLQDATEEPVTLAEAKAQLVIDSSFTRDDTLIAGMITAARLEGEACSHRELAQKRFTLALDQFPSDFARWRISYPLNAVTSDPLFYHFSAGPKYIELLDPLISVDEVRYTDADGQVTVMTADTDYIVDLLKHPGLIATPPDTPWPSPAAGLWPTSAVQIDFTAGFTPETCPQRYKQGILLLVSQWYENRIPYEALRFVAELPFSVASLFGSDPIYRF